MMGEIAGSMDFTKEQSAVLNSTKCIAMLCVLLIHADLRHAVGASITTDIYQQAISSVFAAAAVPVFFTISGYLLFNKFNYERKLKSRVRSLLIPYLLICLWGLFIVFFLQFVLGLSNLFSGKDLKLLSDFTMMDYLKVFWNVRDGAPIISVLWFLRDLIPLVLVSPLILWLLKTFGWWYIGLLFVVNLFGGFHLAEVSSSSLFYFSLGGMMVVNLIFPDDKYLLNNRSLIYAIWFVLLVLTITTYAKGLTVLPFLLKLYILVTIPAIILFCNQPFVRDSVLLKKLLPASFFIYLMHEPWMGYAQKMFYKLVYLPEWTQMIMFWIFPLAILLICYGLFKMMKRYCSGVLFVITGK